MKHRTLDAIRLDAEVVPVAPEADGRARRRRRLERLAGLLERRGGIVNLLTQIEFLSSAERAETRADSSPLTVAYQDPILREEGLAGDTLGEAVTFFSLSDDEAHHLFCDCHYIRPTQSDMVAARVRSIARRRSLGEIWGKIRGAASAAWRFAAP
jgi:hypothetical protein